MRRPPPPPPRRTPLTPTRTPTHAPTTHAPPTPPTNPDALTNPAHAQHHTPPPPDALAALLCRRVIHDLASPITAVSNICQLLEENPQQPPSQEHIQIIRNSAQTAVAVINFSRLAFGSAGAAGAFSLDQAKVVTENLLNSSNNPRVSLSWNAKNSAYPQHADSRIILNIILTLLTCIPSRAELSVSSPNNGSLIFSLNGPNVRMPLRLKSLLTQSTNNTPSASQQITAWFASYLAHLDNAQISVREERNSLLVSLLTPLQ